MTKKYVIAIVASNKECFDKYLKIKNGKGGYFVLIDYDDFKQYKNQCYITCSDNLSFILWNKNNILNISYTFGISHICFLFHFLYKIGKFDVGTIHFEATKIISNFNSKFGCFFEVKNDGTFLFRKEGFYQEDTVKNIKDRSFIETSYELQIPIITLNENEVMYLKLLQ